MGYHRTLILIEVLGNEAYDGEITDLAYDITEGHWSGAELMRESTSVDVNQMAHLLTMQGSDPEFLIEEDDE